MTPFRTSSVVGRPGTDWALGLEYPLAVGRARIVYKVILEKPTFTPGTRKGQVMTHRSPSVVLTRSMRLVVLLCHKLAPARLRVRLLWESAALG